MIAFPFRTQLPFLGFNLRFYFFFHLKAQLCFIFKIIFIILNKYLTLAKQAKKIKIKSFKASEDVLTCIDFYEGYSKVIGSVNSSFTNDKQWFGSQHVHGVIAEHNGQTIGGLLFFHPGIYNIPFPFEQLLTDTISNHQFQTKSLPLSCAEIFAVWNSETASGWGLSYFLIKKGKGRPRAGRCVCLLASDKEMINMTGGNMQSNKTRQRARSREGNLRFSRMGF